MKRNGHSRHRTKTVKGIKRMPSWVQEAISASQDPPADAAAAQIARLIVTRYGGARRLRKLIQLFERGTYIETIGAEFHVTKQRVSQWRKALGFVEERFTPRTLVRQVAEKGIA